MINIARVKRSKWETPDKLIYLEDLCRNGATMQDIAKVIGISKTTLYKWQRESELIAKALTNGKDIADALVENALFTKAITGNVLAQIFWLKNRRPDKWRDKVEHEVKTDIEQEQSGIVILAPRLPQNEPPTESLKLPPIEESED